MITGIICEYNPFHTGHLKQLKQIRAVDPDGTIVCLMSGNYVQRGHPAIINKMARAKAAVLCGADLVLELPLPYVLSSAEGFAAGGVSILGSFCDQLCYGAESSNPAQLMEIAKVLLSDPFAEHLRSQLELGTSFPVARASALANLGIDPQPLSEPNNILAVEYCKAMISQKTNMKPMPIERQGSYHAVIAQVDNPSATAIRAMMPDGDWENYVPAEAASCFRKEVLHDRKHGQAAILGRLRTMTDDEFEALPYGSEGLWRKLMHAARKERSLEDILTATKSKRYTRSRLDRMVMCAFLGIAQDDLQTPAPYARVLALNDKGRIALNIARQTGSLLNIGSQADHPYQALETRAGQLYGLFAREPEAPDAEANYRIFYHHK